VLNAIHRQLDLLPYAHTSFFSSEPAEALAEDLVTHAPAGFKVSQFLSSGSEAVEAALKLSRQYHLERGEPNRHVFISRKHSYHGNTLGALSLTGRESARAPFEILLMSVARVSACFEYRGRQPHETQQEYAQRLADELEAKILRQGPHNVAAFVAETVVGATLGAVAAVPGYFMRVREICDRYGILLILDEVMCGMGRTGTLYACEQEGISPDLITIAKGLGGGYVPLAALLVRGEIIDCVRRGSGAFQHGQTFLGHPLACAGGLAVQQVIRRDGLLENVRRQGERMQSRLRERLANHPFVGDIRGRGLFWGVELVANKYSKEPFGATLALNARVKREAMAAGLLVYPMGGTVNGRDGDHVLIAPPFIVDDATVDAIVDRLGHAVDAATASAVAESGLSR
jgi:adenosylmethionine-8-amino-7-oxononanoate aminotransferase